MTDQSPAGDARDVATAAARVYRHSRPVERTCYLVAVALLADGLVHLAVQSVAGGTWSGPESMRGAANFGLAFGLTLLAVTFASTSLRLAPRARGLLLAGFASACTVEVIARTTQAWRGVPLFFNTATPLDATYAYAAAGGGLLIVASALAFAAATARPNPDVPPHMRLAVVTGFAGFLVANLLGVLMIITGARVARAGSGSATAAYHAAVQLVPAHAAAMQAILLPLLAWLASHTAWSAGRRTHALALACAGYLACAGVITTECLLGINPLPTTAPTAGTATAAAGATVLLATVLAIGHGALTRPSDTLSRTRHAQARRWRDRARATAIGRSRGRHRAFLAATCLTLILAALADAATGYDGPGPFIYPAFAALVALVRWRFTPLFAALMALFFLVGGLRSPAFVTRLLDPGHALEFTAGWLQMLSFAAAGLCALTAVTLTRRGPAHSHRPPGVDTPDTTTPGRSDRSLSP